MSSHSSYKINLLTHREKLIMKLTAQQLKELKNKEKITMLTCYDATMASFLENAKVDVLLVGDSCANVFLGATTTRAITNQQICYHVEAVRNGAANTYILADLDYKSSQTAALAVEGAQNLLKAGADSVKIEGWNKKIIDALNNVNIPFAGHVGLLPQTAENFCVHGKTREGAAEILDYAHELEKAGAIMIIAECIPTSLAIELQKKIKIPIIGIGAGNQVDGQVLVINDMLGITPKTAKFVRRFDEMGLKIVESAKKYIEGVKGNTFPNEKESYH